MRVVKCRGGGKAARRSPSAVYVIQASGWALDGNVLCYHNGDATMGAMVGNAPMFKAGNPKILFRGDYQITATLDQIVTQWGIHPDGDRFLMLKSTAATDDGPVVGGPRKINVVINWFEEQKDRVPVD